MHKRLYADVAFLYKSNMHVSRTSSPPIHSFHHTTRSLIVAHFPSAVSAALSPT